MVRFLAASLLYILANAIGLIITALLLPDFHLTPTGFIISTLFFSAVGIILGPFILKLSIKYAPAFRGGIALVTTFVGLLLTSMFTDGLQITSFATWVVAPLIVWFTVILAGIVLPLFLFKKTLQVTKNSRQSSKSL